MKTERHKLYTRTL